MSPVVLVAALTSPAITRRSLLGLLAGSGLGLLVGCSSGPSEQERACAAVTATFPQAPAGLVVIGTRYQELYPDDDPSQVGLDLPEDDPDAAVAALRDRVRADFDAGEIVDVDGWVLARSEARAAAVLAGC